MDWIKNSSKFTKRYSFSGILYAWHKDFELGRENYFPSGNPAFVTSRIRSRPICQTTLSLSSSQSHQNDITWKRRAQKALIRFLCELLLLFFYWVGLIPSLMYVAHQGGRKNRNARVYLTWDRGKVGIERWKPIVEISAKNMNILCKLGYA